jgi:hypothetical protein
MHSVWPLPHAASRTITGNIMFLSNTVLHGSNVDDDNNDDDDDDDDSGDENVSSLLSPHLYFYRYQVIQVMMMKEKLNR